MKIVGKAQLILALAIYFYAVWNSAPIGIKLFPDWVMHSLGNALLYGSFWWAFFYRRITWQLLIVLLPFSLCVELGQGFTSSRTVSLSDMFANFCGLGLAFLLALYLQRFTQPLAANPES